MQTTDWILHLERLARAGDASSSEPGDRPPDRTLLEGARGEQVLWRAALSRSAGAETARDRVVGEAPEAALDAGLDAALDSALDSAPDAVADDPVEKAAAEAADEARGERLEDRREARLDEPPDEAVDALLRARPERGSLLAPDAFLAIEVWAECELAALHALHRLLRVRRAPAGDWRRTRLAEAARWHLEHTQPDNSTNRPWALHVFLLLDDPSGEARLYAETLVHNACASDARDEPLSRWILADCARELRLATGPAQPPR